MAGSTITANPVPTPTVAYGAPSYYQNDDTNPSPSVAGDTFSAPAGLVRNATTGTIIPTTAQG